ncbi:hypothetical protein DSO57_1011544 [Entomophthora muscae]|uniref:Uncharacterized protein n=1 Tax=Entomophthora muscae TaxID=34485 RepID=A0ACC2U482_9FUNG|nr:hypothetical protein DSO57_1011544 [Entomophthora muscae]
MEGQLVLKKVAAFYNKVPMPCVPVPEQDPDSTTPAIVATEFPELPANVSHNTQRALNEPPLDVSNNMN